MQPASSSPPAASAPLSDASCSSLPRVGVLLIGSGPASLSLLLRVLRPGLSDLWSEDEAQRGGRHATSTKHTQPNDDDECNANHTQQQQQQQHSRSTAPASATMHHSPIPTLTVEQVRGQTLLPIATRAALGLHSSPLGSDAHWCLRVCCVVQILLLCWILSRRGATCGTVTSPRCASHICAPRSSLTRVLWTRSHSAHSLRNVDATTRCDRCSPP